MKKIISAALSLLMVLSLFASCGKKENTPLANAIAYLENMYQTGEKDKPMELLMDKDVLSVVAIDGVPYNVSWTVTVTQGASDSVKVSKSDKANHVSIDVPDLPEEDILFTATATVKDADDKSESVNFSYIVKGLNIPSVDGEGEGDGTQQDTPTDTTPDTPNTPSTPGTTTPGTTTPGTTTKPGTGTDKVPATMGEIVDAAYKLKENAKLPYTATLTGKVTAINDAYSEEFKNITVTITVAGKESKPIKCFRMKGTGVEKIAKGDTITVTGEIKNYNGTIEFDLGCVMNKRISGGGAVTTVLTDPAKIMEAAAALKENTEMEYDVTLTGKVTKIAALYDPAFENISVYINVTGANKELYLYRMKGEEADKLVKGDTITVTGRIINYNGIVEMKPCTMRKRVSGGGTVATAPTDPKKIVDAAFALQPGDSLPYRATLTGKITEIADAYSEQYGNITVIIEVEGTSGKKALKCYRMKGTGADALKVGDVITVSGMIKNYKHSSGDCEVEFDSGCTFTK